MGHIQLLRTVAPVLGNNIPQYQSYYGGYSLPTLAEWVAVRNFFISQSFTPTTTQDTAGNRLVGDLRGYYNPNYPTLDIWNKLILYGLMGGTAATHATNWRNPTTSDAYYLTFYNSPTHNANGIIWNGSNQYADTHIVPSVVSTLSTGIGLHYYARTTTASPGNVYDMGAVTSGSQTFFLSSRCTDGGGTIVDAAYCKAFAGDKFTTNTNGTKGLGLFSVIRNGAGMVIQTQNGASISADGASTGTLPTQSIFVGVTSVPGGAFGYSNRATAAFAVSTVGLTNAEETVLFNALHAYNTTQGRAAAI